MKYDTQLGDLKSELTLGKKVLIALPGQLSLDKLAAGLSLLLSLKQFGIDPVVVTEGTPLVSHSKLFGIGEIKNSLPSANGGNYLISLEGVVEASGQIPALEKLDWYPEGANLNLVFHVLPGQKFEPKNVVNKTLGSNNFELIFVIGASSLNDLGSIYIQNQSIFSGSQIINIDINGQNSGFGKYNIVDPNASSVSEMLTQIMPTLGLNFDQDIASNIVSGIYDATSNLTTNVKPDTFVAVATAMQAGAKLPAVQTVSQPQVEPYVFPGQDAITQPVQPTPQPQVAPVQPPVPQPADPIQTSNPFLQDPSQASNYDLSKVFGVNPNNPGIIQNQVQDQFVSPQVAPVQSVQTSIPASKEMGPAQAPREEKPSGEFAVSSSGESEASPAPDWLTPKIFKGGSLG